MNPLLEALLGLSVSGIDPVSAAKRQIVQPEPNHPRVQPVQGDPTAALQPDRVQPANPNDTPRLQPLQPDDPVTDAVKTSSMDPNSISDAYKTPPDLSQMYLDYMNDMTRRQRLDSGMTLIAAGLAQDQNKQKLIDLAGGTGTGTSGQGDMFKTIFDLQTKAADEARKNALRAQLPQIAKAHKLSLEDVQIMFEDGSLDEFLKEAANPDTEVIEKADGSKVLIDKNTGATIKEISGAKARKKVYTKVGNKEVQVYEDTGEPVNPEEKLPTEVAVPPKLKFEEEPSTGRKLAYDENTGKRLPEMDLAGKDDIEFQKLADGRIQAFDRRSGKTIGEPYGPKTPEPSTDDMKEWVAARAAAEAKGEKFPDFDEWLKTLTKERSTKAPSSNIDIATGREYPNPPTDMTYKRNKDGSFVMDPETNSPVVIPMPGTKLAEEQRKAEEKAGGMEESRKKGATIATGYIDKAATILEEDSFTTPITGIMGSLAALKPGSRANDFVSALDSVKAIVAFDNLSEMRQNSPTGGALGNVSDTELRLLSSTLGSMSNSQSAESIKENLELIRGLMNDDPSLGDKNPAKIALEKWRTKYGPDAAKQTEQPAAEQPDADAERQRKLDEAMKKHGKKNAT